MLKRGHNKGHIGDTNKIVSPVARKPFNHKAMAWVEERKGGASWIACWKQNGKKAGRISTSVPIGSGKTAKEKSRLAALSVAQAMEQAALGLTPIGKACDAVRKAGELCGLGKGKMPSVREYLESYPHTGGESSKCNRMRAFRVFLEFLGADADRPLDLVKPARCQEFVRWLLGSVSKGTASNHKSYISAAFKRAVDVDDLMNKNPMAGVNMAVEAAAVNPERGADVHKREPFTLAEIAYMMREFPAPFADMVAVSWYLAGLRLSDVCLLRWDAVNWGENYVRIVEKKTRKERYLPIIPQLRARLERLRDEVSGGEEYVFPRMARYYLTSSAGYISTQFTALLRAHGMIEVGEKAEEAGRRHTVSKKSFHSIRHGVVSYLRGGVQFSPDAVRDAVGHDSEEVDRGYFTGSLAMREQVCGSLAAALSSPGVAAYSA